MDGSDGIVLLMMMMMMISVNVRDVNERGTHLGNI